MRWVLTLKGKEALEKHNPYQLGQTALFGNSAAANAMDAADALLLVGTDFPYTDWIPTGKTVIQIDARHEHIGRRTAVTYDLPVTFMVFNNERLGMVKLEQEQGGLPEFGKELDNPNIAAVAEAMGLQSRRVEKGSELEDAVSWALATDAPVLLNVLTNPEEVSIPPQPTVSQGRGFAIAKAKEAFESA